MEHTPEMREEVDFSLRTIFHAIQHDGMIGPLGKLPFSPQEQQKIQNRLSTLGRHMAPNPAAGEILVQVLSQPNRRENQEAHLLEKRTYQKFILFNLLILFFQLECPSTTRHPWSNACTTTPFPCISMDTRI